jgi:putative serine protease PepD
MSFKERGHCRDMTETQHDPHTAQQYRQASSYPQAPQQPQPQWTAPRPVGESTLQAREGEYAWRGPGQTAAQTSAPPYGQPEPTAPIGPFGPVPDSPPGAGHAAEPRRSPVKFGLGVVAALVIASAAVGGVAGAYFGSGHGTSAAVVTSITGATTSSATTTVGKVAAAVLPSVVQVNETTAAASGVGSGMIISSDGKIVTNNHVIADYVANGGQLTITLYNGKTYSAKVIGYLAADDIAVIQAEGVSGLTPVTFADSSKVQVGDETIAIGSPDQLQNTVTSGIVSALNRKVSITESTDNGGGFPGFGWRGLGSTTTVSYNAIQTDASINPGNSGGPLLNTAGQVIGMNSAIYSSSGASSSSGSVGLGFAIPANTVTADIAKIESGGGDSSSATS